jgi:23S rRNA (uracil1939-C5)-methyltransferase
MTDELEVTALAAGGDGVARDEGRVTFIPRTAVGDRVRARVVESKKSFARAELVELVTPSADRVAPPCEYFIAGCGGCTWQHIARPAQLAAKHALVTGALRKLVAGGLVVEPVADPAPPFGWRRRTRFHIEGGKVGLYRHGSQDLIAIGHCPQLEPELDAALHVVAAATPPDGELMLLRGHRGEIVVSVEHGWRGAPGVIGRANIVGILAGKDAHGTTTIEIEPGLSGSARDFAQASAAGNAALIELARRALGAGPGQLLELYAGAGNLTRAFAADGWTVHASDVAKPARHIDAAASYRVAAADVVLDKAKGPFDALALDPPRTGAAEAIAGIVKHAPRVVVYVSCDPATLGRDAQQLVEAGYRAERAWPVDLMPQTAHVEVVMRLTR